MSYAGPSVALSLPPHSLETSGPTHPSSIFPAAFPVLLPLTWDWVGIPAPRAASISGDNSMGGTSDADTTHTMGTPFLRKMWPLETFLTTRDTLLWPFLRQVYAWGVVCSLISRRADCSPLPLWSLTAPSAIA